MHPSLPHKTAMIKPDYTKFKIFCAPCDFFHWLFFSYPNLWLFFLLLFLWLFFLHSRSWHTDRFDLMTKRIRMEGHRINLYKYADTGSLSSLGPVVQSVVSLTSSLRVISLTVLADSIYNFLKFFAEKMWVAFALQKLLTFFQQKISEYLRITQCKF